VDARVMMALYRSFQNEVELEQDDLDTSVKLEEVPNLK